MDGMPIKDINGYRERMSQTMTAAEKLFFMDHLDLYTYNVIIDFGGADGTLIHHIQTQWPDLADDCLFIIVDNNPQMQTAYQLKNCIRVTNLSEVGTKLKTANVLFICNSVLHECSITDVDSIFEFCKQYVRTFVSRDMAYTAKIWHPDEPLTYQDFKYFKGFFNTLENNESLQSRFMDMLEYGNKWRLDKCSIVTQFILKYTYTENWDSELRENYFSNNIVKLSDRLIADGWYTIFSKTYILPFKEQQARREFNAILQHPTHMQIILTRGDSNKNEIGYYF